MRLAIETRYLAPTNHSGARIIVTSGEFRKVVPWDCSLGPEENHYSAAAVASRLGSTHHLIGGETKFGFAFIETQI